MALRNGSLAEMLGPGALWLEEPVDRSLSEATLVADREGRVSQLVEEVLRFAKDWTFRDATGQARREFVEQFTDERFVKTMHAFYEQICDV